MAPPCCSSPAATAHRVAPRVFIGGYLAASDPETVRRMGVTRIVKMFGDDASYPGGYHRHPGVAYAVFPALDVPWYDIREDAEAALRFVVEGVDAGERVLVHCHAGISRSATVVLLYLMTAYGLGLEPALAYLRDVRSVVNPNAGFMEYLRAADARLAGARRADAAQ